MKRSIRDFDTTGLKLYQRERLYEKVIPIEIGSVVFESPGFFGNVKKITVDEKNQKVITMFWNSMYFDNINDAQKDANISYAYYVLSSI